MVPLQAYNRLKAHLNTLVKKHLAFRDMILTGGGGGLNANRMPPAPPDFNLDNLIEEPVFEKSFKGNMHSLPKFEKNSNKENDDLVSVPFDVYYLLNY